MVVYVDLLMGVNFAVDFLLLLGTNRLAGFPAGAKRAAAASALGAVYSGACVFPALTFLGNRLWRVVSLALMGTIAFGWNRSAWNRSLVFCLLAMALGGLAVQLGEGKLVWAVAGMWLLCRMGFRQGLGKTYSMVELSARGKQHTLTVLHDTGNSLRDPVSGEPVMVLGADAAQLLLGLTAQELEAPLETVRRIPGLRLIPYRAVGQTGGLLLACRENVLLDGKWEGRIIAFSPQNFGGGYQGII